MQHFAKRTNESKQTFARQPRPLPTLGRNEYLEREKDSTVPRHTTSCSRRQALAWISSRRMHSVGTVGFCSWLALQLCTSVGCGTLGSRQLASSLPPLTSAAPASVPASASLSLSDEGSSADDYEAGSTPALAQIVAAPIVRLPEQSVVQAQNTGEAEVVAVTYQDPIYNETSNYGDISPSDTNTPAATPVYGEPLSSPEVLTTNESYAIPLSNPIANFREVECGDGFEVSASEFACVSGCSGGACGCSAPAMSQPRNVQEYIFDGGDQQSRVAIKKDWTAAGVDPTDTVIYYETLDGKVCVRPSNRVPIYAPRFGAVRQVAGVVLAARSAGTGRILAPVTANAFRESDLVGNLNGPLAPQAEQQVGMLDRFQENRRGVPIAQSVPPKRYSSAQKAFESIEFLTTGMMLDHEIPVIGRILANARTWYTPESLGVMIDGQAAGLVVDAKRAQDVHVYEMPDRCAMRICKGASHTIANSGDIVSFTIRFDNVGPKPLGNAVILDSLSPRLEYIDGSQQSSIAAKFSSTPNEAGSATLQWEIESAIKTNEGGVISFDCLVR